MKHIVHYLKKLLQNQSSLCYKPNSAEDKKNVIGKKEVEIALVG